MSKQIIGETSWMEGLTLEQKERAVTAAKNRTADPLCNWSRPHREECSICLLPLPMDPNQSKYNACCSKVICYGCHDTQLDVLCENMASCGSSNFDERVFEAAVSKAKECPFCRGNSCENLEQTMRLADMGQPEAIQRIGDFYYSGSMGLKQSISKAVQWYKRAMDCGMEHGRNARAACMLGGIYANGLCSDEDSEERWERVRDLFLLAIEYGYTLAYSALGDVLMRFRGEVTEAVLNLRMIVMCGLSDAETFSKLRACFKEGFITKEEYAFTLRENQAACDEMKSAARERYRKKSEEETSAR